MDSSELLLLLLFGFFSYKFLHGWYSVVQAAWPAERVQTARRVLGLLPAGVCAVVVAVLVTLASFDVVDSVLFVIFYLLFGLVWLYACVSLMPRLLDLSYKDDVLNLNNPAALWAFVGACLGVTLVYCGANVGDGPGWWTVLVAGFLGTVTWFLLAMAAGKLADVFERVTVGRDAGCGIRLCGYLVGSGVLLARASAGDWTSSTATFIEFLDGWPVLLLCAGFILAERAFIAREKNSRDQEGGLALSVLLGALYLAAGIVAALLLGPLPTNPIYS